MRRMGREEGERKLKGERCKERRVEGYREGELVRRKDMKKKID